MRDVNEARAARTGPGASAVPRGSDIVRARRWIAPRNPKLEFAGHRALYKLYVFATIPPGKSRQNADFCGDFIRAFIPVAQEALRPAMEKAGRLHVDEPAPAAAG